MTDLIVVPQAAQWQRLRDITGAMIDELPLAFADQLPVDVAGMVICLVRFLQFGRGDARGFVGGLEGAVVLQVTW